MRRDGGCCGSTGNLRVGTDLMELEEHVLNKHDTANMHRQEEEDETD